MGEQKDEIRETIKSFLIKGEIAEALDQLYSYSLKIDAHFSNEVLLLIQRFEVLKKRDASGIISTSDYQLEHNKIASSLLYLLDQIPNPQRERTPAKKRKGGKLLHNISSQMPVGLETKCVIRIAESEEIVKAFFKVDENTVIEDIPVSKVMEVQLIDFANEKSFEIRSFNYDEQVIQEGDYTEWLFFVKPLREGLHTLYLKVSIVEYIENDAKKKDIVLEQKIAVVSDVAEVSDVASNWKDTSIHIEEEKAPKRGGSFLAKKIRLFGISFSVLLLLLMSGVSMAAVYLTYNFVYFKKEVAVEEEVKDTIAAEPVKIVAPIDTQEQLIEKTPEKISPPTVPDTIVEEKKPLTKQEKLDTLIARAKRHGFQLVDELTIKDTSAVGEKILIEVRTNGFKRNEISFFIGSTKRYEIQPSGRDGKKYYFELDVMDKVHTFTIVDTDSGNSISQKIKGNTNYMWKVSRTTGGLGF